MEDATCPRLSSLSSHRIPIILTPLSSSIHLLMVPGLYLRGAACITRACVVGCLPFVVGAAGGGQVLPPGCFESLRIRLLRWWSSPRCTKIPSRSCRVVFPLLRWCGLNGGFFVRAGRSFRCRLTGDFRVCACRGFQW